MAILLRHPVHVTGAGRTDAGVHACGQVAHFDTEIILDQRRFLRSINALLPLDVRVCNLIEVDEQFHARYSALGKVYHYHLHLSPVTNPFRYKYALHCPQKLNLDHLKEAASYLVGTHDFTSFANSPTEGSVSRDPVRTLKRLDLVPQEGGVRLEFEADGFLYKMVRNMVGALLAVAQGKAAPSFIPSLLQIKNRKEGFGAAPPQGLFLMNVYYAN
jgi:tRNA pseudouridine38-40 synthase